MQKLVNVYTKYVIRSLKGLPIRSTVKAIYLDTEDIRTCIISKAIVEEILDDGSVLPLNFANYNKDNNAQFRAAAPSKKEKKAAKVEEPAPVVETVVEEVAPVAETVVEEAPVAEETVVEETAEEAVEEAAEEATEEAAEGETTEAKSRNRRRKNNN